MTQSSKQVIGSKREYQPLDLKGANLERHSFTIAGHRTSISIERIFWDGLHQVAKTDGVSLAELVRRLDEERAGSLSGAVRCYVIQRLASF